MKQALILAGGKGTRLKDRLGDLPKPMIDIGGRPLLEHQIVLAKRHGFTHFLLLLGYGAETIRSYFDDGAKWGVQIDYVIEEVPLGTAGAVLGAFGRLADRFVVLYGDVMVNVDLSRLWDAHAGRGVDATLLLHPNDHPYDSDLVQVGADGLVTAFHNRPHPSGASFQNLVNAALYVVEKRSLEPWAGEVKSMDFGNDLFPAMVRSGCRLLGYSSPEYVKDIGTPRRYDRVCSEVASGLVQRSSLDVPQAAVFLDRDGVLNREIDGVMRPEQLELLPGVPEAVGLLNQAGLRAVVVTNQPMIAKGFCSEADLQLVHNHLETLLGREHAFLDRIYHCPHHPEKGFAGERPEYKIACQCRKPGIGMILQAKKDLNLDLSGCWMIGDTTTDLQTARNAGVRGLLVETGFGGKDSKYPVGSEPRFSGLLEAVRHILQSSVLGSNPPQPV